MTTHWTETDLPLGACRPDDYVQPWFVMMTDIERNGENCRIFTMHRQSSACVNSPPMYDETNVWLCDEKWNKTNIVRTYGISGILRVIALNAEIARCIVEGKELPDAD